MIESLKPHFVGPEFLENKFFGPHKNTFISVTIRTVKFRSL